MRFELTNEFLVKLRQAILAKNGAFVNEHFKDLYPPDIAEIFNELQIEESMLKKYFSNSGLDFLSLHI